MISFPSRVLITLTCLFAEVATLAQPSNPPSVFLEELTWTEVQGALDNGIRTIILPTGGTEQNGPHMTLGKHNVRVKYMAEKVALQLGDALVAPTLGYVPEGEIDPPTGHMKYAGTIHLPEEHFMKVLEYAARSFKKHGFTDIVLIGDSGPNQNGMKVVSGQLNLEWKATNTRVHFISTFYQAPESTLLFDSLANTGIPAAAFGTHAGLQDVSYSLAVDTSLVRRDIIRQLTDDKKKNLALGFSGDPKKATAQIGARIVEVTIRASVAQIQLLKKENRK